MDALRAAAGLVWGVLSGPTLSADDRALLRTGLGGVVLFGRNIRSPEQLRQLTADVRAAATSPVIVAIDQEGGHIIRIGEPLTRLPSAMAIGATGDPALAYAVARASAVELAACGIDVVCAPVLDVALDRHAAAIGARSFGEDPALVARMGRETIRGYLDGGVLPVAKHFPGHGRTATDSHLALPVVHADVAALDAVDLVPFHAAVDAEVPALMTSHVVYAAIDPAHPASLSPAVADLARRRLQFDGLLVTDALVMDAIAHRQPIEAAASAAIAAGADAVMALDPAWRVIDRLEFDIRRERLDPARVAAAVGHAARFAAAARSTRVSTGRTRIGALPHRGAADRVARAALTLVAGERLLPIRPAERVVVIDVASARRSPIEDERGTDPVTAAAIAAAWRASLVVLDPRDPGPLDAAHKAAEAADRVIVLTRDAFVEPVGASLIRSFLGRRSVHVALRSPTDLELSTDGVAIAAYHEGPAVAAALVRALGAGTSALPGRLPLALGPSTSSILLGAS